MRKAKLDKENQELTYMPKLNRKMNSTLILPSNSGEDHLVELYKKSKLKEKANKPSDEYWFEKDKEECKFQPVINKGIRKQSVYEIKGLDKQKQRMQKAREEAEFKKKMTERSTFSATVGVKKVKKMIKKGQEVENGSFRYSIDQSKFKTIGEKEVKMPPKKMNRV